MSELSMSPVELFRSRESDVISVNINGIDTFVLELSDENRNYLAIPATDKDLSKICFTFVLNHLITRVTYDTYQGKVAIIKAYY